MARKTGTTCRYSCPLDRWFRSCASRRLYFVLIWIQGIKVLYALAALLRHFFGLIHFDVYLFCERYIAPEELAIKLYHIWSIAPGNSFAIIFNFLHSRVYIKTFYSANCSMDFRHGLFQNQHMHIKCFSLL